MDAKHFDTLTRAFPAVVSRRVVLRFLTALATAGTVGRFVMGEAGSTHFECRHVDVRCKRNRQCCSNRCQRAAEGQPKTCRPHHTGICTASQDHCTDGASNTCGPSPSDCFCWKTTGGGPFCGYAVYCPFEPCTKDKDCYAAFGGQTDVACIVCTGLCGSGGFCATPCPNPVSS